MIIIGHKAPYALYHWGEAQSPSEAAAWATVLMASETRVATVLPERGPRRGAHACCHDEQHSFDLDSRRVIFV